jgi:hypothetical protein
MIQIKDSVTCYEVYEDNVFTGGIVKDFNNEWKYKSATTTIGLNLMESLLVKLRELHMKEETKHD